jgi:hypothetical protein
LRSAVTDRSIVVARRGFDSIVDPQAREACQSQKGERG